MRNESIQYSVHVPSHPIAGIKRACVVLMVYSLALAPMLLLLMNSGTTDAPAQSAQSAVQPALDAPTEAAPLQMLNNFSSAISDLCDTQFCCRDVRAVAPIAACAQSAVRHMIAVAPGALSEAFECCACAVDTNVFGRFCFLPEGVFCGCFKHDVTNATYFPSGSGSESGS